jgi:hypothetical protein
MGLFLHFRDRSQRTRQDLCGKLHPASPTLTCLWFARLSSHPVAETAEIPLYFATSKFRNALVFKDLMGLFLHFRICPLAPKMTTAPTRAPQLEDSTFLHRVLEAMLEGPGLALLRNHFEAARDFGQVSQRARLAPEVGRRQD